MLLLAMQLSVSGVVVTTLGPHMATLSQYSGPGATMPPAVALQAMGSFFSTFALLIGISVAASGGARQGAP